MKSNPLCSVPCVLAIAIALVILTLLRSVMMKLIFLNASRILHNK